MCIGKCCRTIAGDCSPTQALAGNGGTEVELDLAYKGMRASGLRLAAWWKSRPSNTGGNCVAMAGPTRREPRRPGGSWLCRVVAVFSGAGRGDAILGRRRSRRVPAFGAGALATECDDCPGGHQMVEDEELGEG